MRSASLRIIVGTLAAVWVLVSWAGAASAGPPSDPGGSIATVVAEPPPSVTWSPADLPTPDGEGVRLTQGPGGVVLSWAQQGPKGPILRASSWSARGWSRPETVAVVPGLVVSWADPPTVIDGVGHRAATWLVEAGHGAHMQASRRAAKGRWSTPVRVHSDQSETEHGFATLFPLADGTTDIAWLDGRDQAAGGAGRTGLYRRILGADGALGPEQIVDPRTCDCCPTSGVKLAGEAPLLAWRDRLGGEVRDISTTHLGAGTDPLRVSEDGWEFGGCPVNGPAVAPYHDGFAVAWMTEAGGPRVRYAFGRGVEAFTPPTDLAVGEDVLGRVASTALPGDQLLITWVEGTEESATLRGVVFGELTRSAPVILGPVPGPRSAGFHRLATRQDDVLVVFGEAGHAVGRSIPLDQLHRLIPE